MFTDYLIKVVWGGDARCAHVNQMLLGCQKYCWVAKSIAGLPKVRETLLQKNVSKTHIHRKTEGSQT